MKSQSPMMDGNINYSDITILVVDDNQYMRQLLGHMLRAFDVGTFLHATNTKEALEEIRQTRVDCLIVDWLMPGMSGIDFVRLIRTSPQSSKPDIPIILCTGYTEKERVIEARDAGVSEILTKPLSPSSLLDKLERVIFHPRPFIITPKYTGPCRRRHNKVPYEGFDRRQGSGLHQDDIDALLHS